MNLLKNIETIGSGQNAPQEEREYSVLGKTFIKVSNLDDIIQDQNESRACKITADAINKNKLKLYPKNTIIFAKSGLSCVKNRVYLTKDDSYIVNHLCTISNINNDYYPKWLLYFIKKYDVTKLIHDESYPSISLKDIGKIEIPEVGLNIQILISNQLDSIIETINKKLVQLNQLNELVKSRFIEMFGHYFEDVRYFVKVGDIATATIGLTYKPDNVTDEGIIVLRSGNIQNAELCLSDDIVRVSNIRIKEYKFVRENDILMCSRNGSARLVGKCCLIPKLNEQMSYGAFMTIIRSKYPYFLNGFFNSTYFLQQLTGTQTASVNQITTGMLNSYTVIKPSDTEENEFAEFVKLIDKSKFVCYSKYFLWLNLTFVSSTIAYSNVVSILE